VGNTRTGAPSTPVQREVMREGGTCLVADVAVAACVENQRVGVELRRHPRGSDMVRMHEQQDGVKHTHQLHRVLALRRGVGDGGCRHQVGREHVRREIVEVGDAPAGGAVCVHGAVVRRRPRLNVTQRALSVTQRALSVTQRALSVTQRALSVTQRALSVTQRALSVTQRALSVTQRALSFTQRGLDVTQRALSVTQRALSVQRHPARS
jgi:hypothetical protein